jgi:hypothetical protein
MQVLSDASTCTETIGNYNLVITQVSYLFVSIIYIKTHLHYMKTVM